MLPLALVWRSIHHLSLMGNTSECFAPCFSLSNLTVAGVKRVENYSDLAFEELCTSCEMRTNGGMLYVKDCRGWWTNVAEGQTSTSPLRDGVCGVDGSENISSISNSGEKDPKTVDYALSLRTVASCVCTLCSYL